MGAIGPAIIFMLSLVGSVIVGAYVLAFSASALLIVVEGTAAGNDEVPWSKEPWADIIGRAVYLASLIGLWMIPAGFICNGLSGVFLPNDTPLRLLLIALPGLWLFFPLGLFSSLRSLSGYGFLRFDMIRDLLRVFPATLLFYAVSFLLGFGVGFIWYLTLGGNALYLIVAAPVTSFAWLVYARLLGRLGLKIGMLKQREKPTEEAPPEKRPAKKSKGKKGKRSKQEAEADEEPEMGPVMPSHEPIPEQEKQARPAWLDPEPEPYAFGDDGPLERPDVVPLDGYDPIDAEEVEPTRPGEDRIAATNRALAQRDKRLTRKKKPPKLPDRPMFEGVWTFPFYPKCIAPMINVAFGLAAFGVLLLLMLQGFSQIRG